MYVLRKLVYILKKEKLSIIDFHIPRWEELPDIDLYSDQTVTILENYLSNYIGNKDEKIITKSMINNYVKQGIIHPPIKKKYNKEHIAKLFVICILKQIYSISDISELIKLAITTSSIDISYNKFCTYLEDAIKLVFAGKEYIEDNSIQKEEYLLKYVVLSFANKLYVEKEFLHK